MDDYFRLAADLARAHGRVIAELDNRAAMKDQATIDALVAALRKTTDAAMCAAEFIASVKELIPDWRERMKVDSEGYSQRLINAASDGRAALAAATGD